MRQYTREDWVTRNGVLLSGAVTEDRNIRQPIYSRLAGLFAGRRELPEYRAAEAPRVLPLRTIPFAPSCKYLAIDLQPQVDNENGKQSWVAFESRMKQFWATNEMVQDQWKRTGQRFQLWRTPAATISGVSFRFPVLEGWVRPLVLTPEFPEVNIPIAQQCSKLHILGQVTFPVGFPVKGGWGETVAVYSFLGAGGESQDQAVRNGFEAAQANRIHQATRIDPVAKDAQPALEFVKDIVREQYQFLLWSVEVKPQRLQSLRCELTNRELSMAILAVTIEQRSY